MSFPNDFQMRRARFTAALKESVEKNKRSYALIASGKFPAVLLQNPDLVLGEAFKFLRESLEADLERNVKRASVAADPQALMRTEADAVALSHTLQVFYFVEATVRAQRMLADAVRAVAGDSKRRIADIYKELSEKPTLTKDEKELLNILMTVFGDELRKKFDKGSANGSGQ